MVKCGICREKLRETFLNKPLGTVVKDAKGKAHWVCKSCQRGKTKADMLHALK